MTSAPTAPEIRLMDVTRSDVPAIVELMHECGLWTDLDAEAAGALIRWAVFDNPFAGAVSRGTKAVWKEALVGVYLKYCLPYRCGDWAGIAQIPLNFCVRPGAPATVGARLLRAMLRPPADGLVAGSHTTAASMAAYERLGGRFAVASDLEFSLTVSRWRRAVAGIRRRGRVMEKIGRALGSFHVGSGETFPRGATLGRIATIESEEGIDSLCLEAFPDTPFGVIRSREYLAWRYARAPFADSLFSVIRRSPQGRLVGLAILQVNADGARIAVAEALAAPEEREALATALPFAARALGGAVLETRAISGPWSKVWRRLGWTPITTGHPHLWLLGGKGLSLPKPLEAVYSWGDHKIHWSSGGIGAK